MIKHGKKMWKLEVKGGKESCVSSRRKDALMDEEIKETKNKENEKEYGQWERFAKLKEREKCMVCLLGNKMRKCVKWVMGGKRKKGQ